MDSNFICIGHRGAMGYRPENTLAAFELAIDQGCTWLELDVHVCEDQLVVIHDDALDRTTNGTGSVAAAAFEYVRGLDAGDGEQVPTLEEVIDCVGGRAAINVELKGKHTAAPVCALLDRYCEADLTTEHFLLSSFDHEELARADTRYRRGALFSRRSRGDRVAKAVALGAWSINLDLSIVDADSVHAAHESGLTVLVYTVNERPDIRRMMDLGVDGIFCNFPDRVFEMI